MKMMSTHNYLVGKTYMADDAFATLIFISYEEEWAGIFELWFYISAKDIVLCISIKVRIHVLKHLNNESTDIMGLDSHGYRSHMIDEPIQISNSKCRSALKYRI